MLNIYPNNVPFTMHNALGQTFHVEFARTLLLGYDEYIVVVAAGVTGIMPTIPNPIITWSNYYRCELRSFKDYCGISNIHHSAYADSLNRCIYVESHPNQSAPQRSVQLFTRLIKLRIRVYSSTAKESALTSYTKH